MDVHKYSTYSRAEHICSICQYKHGIDILLQLLCLICQYTHSRTTYLFMAHSHA